MLPDDDLDGELGTLDDIAMDEVRSAFTGLDGLIDGVGFQNLADPGGVHVYFTDGIGDATNCRLDIRWCRRGYNNIHHTDSTDRNFRWEYHPKVGPSDKHFRPSPDAPSKDVEQSCLTAEEPPVVARVVHKLWRRASDTTSTEQLNSATGGL